MLSRARINERIEEAKSWKDDGVKKGYLRAMAEVREEDIAVPSTKKTEPTE